MAPFKQHDAGGYSGSFCQPWPPPHGAPPLGRARLEANGCLTFSRDMGLLQLLKTQFLCHLFICYVFVVSGLIVNLLQLCTLPVWLVDKQLARKLNIRLGYCVSSRKWQRSNIQDQLSARTETCLHKLQ